ncbi:MAG TPA: hypothetical protein VM425_12430 [Myxococcota bacterium]|nr:hypothetical protein [Myxococcota bacterium]
MNRTTCLVLSACLLVPFSACRQRPRNPHAGEAVQKCLNGLKQAARGMGPASKFTVLAGACKDLYVETVCRKAFGEIAAVPPDRRAAIIAESCRRAYCPKLEKPLPELCGPHKLPANPMRLLPLWHELQWAILSRDLGPKLASRLYARLVFAELAIRPIFISTPMQVELPRAKAGAPSPDLTPSPSN